MTELGEKLLYPYAVDKLSLIVKAVDAVRGGIYSCMGCGERMVLRRGRVRRAHFGHYSENKHCAPETVLHKMAKDAIRQGIEKALSMGDGYPFKWFCHVCGQDHEGNLALSPRGVKTEVELDGVRPDVLVSSIKGKHLVAIEVVVSHWPEEEARMVYKDLNIPVLMVKPGWEDLEDLKSGLGEVDTFNAPCRAKRCPKCSEIMKEVVIGAFEGYKCGHCGKGMLVVGLVSGSDGYLGDLKEGWIKPARSVGVVLKRISVASYGWSYVVHGCPACGASEGDGFWESEWFNDVMMGGGTVVKTSSYSWCECCDIWIENKRAVRQLTALRSLYPVAREKGQINE